MAEYTLRVYSLIPYVKRALDPQGRYQKKLSFFYAFKNGRKLNDDWSFAQLIDFIVDRVSACPAISPNLPLVIPVPRSGRSEPSRDPNSHPFPCLALADALERANITWDWEEVLRRTTPLSPSSSRQVRRTIAPHLGSMKAVRFHAYSDIPIMLLDDVLASGSQLMACFVLLRQAGYNGPIFGLTIAQTVPDPYEDKHLQENQIHELSWTTGWSKPKRDDVGTWP